MSIENHTFEFLEAAVNTAIDGEALYGAETLETVYQTIKREFGIRVGDCEAKLAPLPGGEAIEEFDGLVTLSCFARVAGTNKTMRMVARDKAIEVAKAAAKHFLDDPTMQGRVRNSRVVSARRGFENIGSQPYAVCNLELIVNETGQLG
jgi:hypothetical protein